MFIYIDNTLNEPNAKTKLAIEVWVSESERTKIKWIAEQTDDRTNQRKMNVILGFRRTNVFIGSRYTL